MQCYMYMYVNVVFVVTFYRKRIEEERQRKLMEEARQREAEKKRQAELLEQQRKREEELRRQREGWWAYMYTCILHIV